MIYIDPPYNTGNDFVYADDFKIESNQWDVESGVVSEDGVRFFKNTDSNGRFHSDWCTMLFSRLMLARNLLSNDGVIFISIDDAEQGNLKKICDEVFGVSKKCFPELMFSVLGRGEEVLNDVTCEEAKYVGLDSIAEIISNGSSIAGTVYDMLPEDAKEAIDNADVILAKGQGNYETLSGQGRHIFYSLLCKCDLFTNRFGVPKLTGLFVEEKAVGAE